MEKTTLNVSGMNCQHCVKSITEGLNAVEGVEKVVVSLENKTVTVEHVATVTKEALASEIEEIGYDVVNA